ncbi:MAG TPA: CpaF family protein [Anaerolineales bacterium]|nr:CpaF family protein [Anaerolineales bacterium]
MPDILQLKTYLTTALRQEMEANPPAPGALRQDVTQMLEQITQRARLKLDDRLRQNLFREILDEVIGYGPIQPFLDQSDISEIMVNGPGCIYIERAGELIETSARFESADQVLRLIDRMLHPIGRSVDADHPMADARLPDGSRVNAVIPPVAIDGPCITIRKFLRNTMTIQEYIQLGSLTEHMAEFLQACVAARLNVLISGPTSSGKTTFLNILTGFIPGEERIITIEDAVELQLKQKHVLRLETKSRNVDGAGEVTARDLVRNCLRMRPDRIIIGEVRSGEALDMLQAMNTGHQGSLTTLHANSPRDALSRLETMVMMSGLELPLLAIRRQIASAINLVVHMSRLTDGARKITHLTEVSGMEGEVVTMSDIFKFEQTGVGPDGKVLGQLKATGLRPMFSPRLEVVGYKLRGEIFGAGLGRF